MDSHDDDRGQIALLALAIVAVLGLDLPRPFLILTVAAAVAWVVQKTLQR